MTLVLTMPKLSPTMEAGTIVKWHKKEGDRVEAGDLLFEVATDKATIEYNALDEGWFRKITIREGELAGVGQTVAIMTETQNESFDESVQQEKKTTQTQVEEKKTPAFKQESPPSNTDHKRLRASPLAKKLAKDRNINLSTLKGSGPGGRILKRDLESTDSSFEIGSEVRKIPLSHMRKTIARRLQESKATIPHFYLNQDVEVSQILEIRKQLKESQQESPTINDFIIKAAALSLAEFPEMNSGFDSKENALIRFQSVNVAVAVSLEDGLITPVVKKADKSSIFDISKEIKQLAKKAREGRLQPSEYEGGSFTISNLGMHGIQSFHAIINPPQAAILAVGALRETPVVREGNIEIGNVLTLTLSVDHRVIDGALAARFLINLKKHLELPTLLIL